MVEMENDVNSCAVAKIIRSKNKALYIAATYRQWQGQSQTCRYNKYKNEDQIRRLKDLIQIWEKMLKKNQQILIAGDLNLDRHQPNNPLSRAELKDLIPLFEDFIEVNNVTQLNWLPTRFRANQKPSTLDLYITNIPKKTKDIRNVSNITSEHQGVTVNIEVNDIQIREQFFTVRDYKSLTNNNLEPMVNEHPNLQDCFNFMNPNLITPMINDGLSEIINKIAPEKRIQKNNKEIYWSRETIEMKHEADNLLTHAINI